MPTAVKSLENMEKHLTKDEIEARAAAEAAFLPERTPIKPPKAIKGDKLAVQHWKRIIRDMDGLGILDILDTDALGIYCAQLSRREDLLTEYKDLRKKMQEEEDLDDRQKLTKLMREINKDVQTLETAILTYSSKLGLNPEARARLAKRAAEEQEPGEDDDLFA